ncbi:hypothetical protein [Chitinophaga sp. S165]|uniref:hypothetical protein n=1 Tax=Chitinophaga sp. S165 TaxID=2135462 RepID=UPI000D717D4C|nr:hypothetical protein [Chitinophaga sp. S165]PWV47156.1 hypothetical protein C7475_109244 [Chitinophaga sp. S165]
MHPHNFCKTINIDGTPIEFEFNTMNVQAVELFQVYFSRNNERQKRRFHMQRNAEGEFYITDKHTLLAGLDIPAQVLADAILDEHGLR